MSEDMAEQGSNHWGPGHVARKLITVGAAGNQEILRRLARVPNEALGCSAMALGDYEKMSFEDVVIRILSLAEYLESSGPEYRRL